MLQSLSSTILSPTLIWVPVAAVASLAIISILALLYALSPFLGRTDLRAWAKIKIYDVSLSLLLIAVFAGIVYLLSSINFANAFGSNLVPSSCSYASSPQNANLSTLALCDLSLFDSNVSTLNELSFLGMFFIGASASKEIPLVNLTQQALTLKITSSISAAPSSLSSLYFAYIVFFFTFYILSRILMYLLAISVLIFSVLMALGLISRVFVVTRSFGGAMIAFAVGLGIILPLVIAVSYGFLDVTIANIINQAPKIAATSTIIGIVLFFMFGSIAVGLAGAIANILPPLLSYVGFMFAGLLVIPAIDILLVDVFIRDFSKAVGEQMDFMSLLTSVI